jgi:hypothetical protein
MRATMSVGPPAATGTMMRTGRCGKSPLALCARASGMRKLDANAGAAASAIK